MIETNLTQEKEISTFYEKHWIFGSNSGIFQYVFNKKDGVIIEIDPYEKNYKEVMGKIFIEFINTFKKKKFG